MAPLLSADVSNFHLSFILMTQAAEDRNKQEKKNDLCPLFRGGGSDDEKKMFLFPK